VFVVTLLVLFPRKFLQADPVSRRQIKWVLYSYYIYDVPILYSLHSK
jgi:hypothetical protein